MSPLDVCRSYLSSFATGDAELVASHVTEGFVNEHAAASGVGCVGIDEYRRRLPAFLASMPGLRYDVEDEVTEGEKVVLAYVLRATVDGREIAVPGVMRFEVADGRIARRVDYWDSLVFRRQMEQA